MPKTRDNTCPDCGAQVGQLHENGCDVERCPEDGRQLLMCGHDVDERERMPWTGLWPGTEECREYGFVLEGMPPDSDGGPWPNLNRLITECVWDRRRRRWVRRA